MSMAFTPLAILGFARRFRWLVTLPPVSDHESLYRHGNQRRHQRINPDTLVGKARRDARNAAVNDVLRLWALPIPRKAIENPVGALSSMWRKPTQVIQPYEFGDDASKATCLWLDGLMPLTPTCRKQGRLVEWPKGSGKMVERWANQTDSGQNNATPHDDRWQNRSDTFTGIAEAFANQWG